MNTITTRRKNAIKLEQHDSSCCSTSNGILLRAKWKDKNDVYF